MPVGSKYDDEHRIFLQGFMCKGLLNTKDTMQLLDMALTKCQVEVPDSKPEKKDCLIKMVQAINQKLEPLDFAIRKGVDEDDGTNYLVLVNTSNRLVGGSRDLACKVQRFFSEAELDFIRILAMEILDSSDGQIHPNLALNLAQQVVAGKRFSMKEAEKTIQRLVDEKWLKIVGARGNIALGVRFLVEMEDWIIQMTEGDVDKCPSCRKLVIRGAGCSCGNIYHRFCLKKLTDAAGGSYNCQSCGAPVLLTDPSTRSQAAKKSKKRSSNSERSTQILHPEIALSQIQGMASQSQPVVSPTSGHSYPIAGPSGLSCTIMGLGKEAASQSDSRKPRRRRVVTMDSSDSDSD